MVQTKDIKLLHRDWPGFTTQSLASYDIFVINTRLYLRLMNRYPTPTVIYITSSSAVYQIKTHGRVSVAKKDVQHTSVLFTGTAKLLFSTPHISITTGPISIKFTYFMPSIYTTLHTTFDKKLDKQFARRSYFKGHKFCRFHRFLGLPRNLFH